MDQSIATDAAAVLNSLLITKTIVSIFSGIPSMIMSSGLIATGAFLLARSTARTSPSQSAYNQAATALLLDAAKHAQIEFCTNDPWKTLDNIASAEPRQYLLAETRARMYATWLARLAAARADLDEPAVVNESSGSEQA